MILQSKIQTIKNDWSSWRFKSVLRYILDGV